MVGSFGVVVLGSSLMTVIGFPFGSIPVAETVLIILPLSAADCSIT